ncbi:HAMP domain-containing sensor histidine kinase [Salinisphaera sp. SPP-AMP-43]|uniref:sensor histidine kinase n=1 Tax=Salinisphaera sp. SPP-AMP-43 TaxID=3121288 RepID=UPI003C6E89A5
MVYFAALEILGQPLYYYIWSDVYPQSYESVWLRSICVLISLPMLFEPHLSRMRHVDKWLAIYWLFSLLFELPFFFFYMTLMNDVSAVWALSSLAALMILVILVFDWLMTILLTFIGASMAWMAFLVMDGNLHTSQEIPLPILFAIYLFGIIVGSAVNYKSELIAREKLAAITDAMATVAHELRTPLLGIRSGARGLSAYLPDIMEGYEMARSQGLPVRPVRRAHFEQMRSVLDRIHTESEYTGVVLDMLLVNANRASIDRSVFEPVRMSECVETALARYPFHSSRERQRISWQNNHDFRFFGSQLLMVHVFFNLLKNAIYHIAKTEDDDGAVFIWTSTDPDSGINELHFKDTGPGIAPEVLPRIFERFYSGMPRGQGTGIGLAFVKLVIDSFGGYIRCDSVLGEYTEFTLSFLEPDNNDD